MSSSKMSAFQLRDLGVLEARTGGGPSSLLAVVPSEEGSVVLAAVSKGRCTGVPLAEGSRGSSGPVVSCCCCLLPSPVGELTLGGCPHWLLGGTRECKNEYFLFLTEKAFCVAVLYQKCSAHEDYS